MENHDDILDRPLSPTPAATPAYARIGGWLILPAMGLIGTPLIILFSLFSSITPLFADEVWHELTHPDGAYYHPRMAFVITFELIGNTIVAVSSIILAIFFFQKRRFVPLGMIVFYAGNLIFLITDHLLTQSIPLMADALDFESNRQLIRSISTAIIWIPYFAISERVKGTFVH